MQQQDTPPARSGSPGTRPWRSWPDTRRYVFIQAFRIGTRLIAEVLRAWLG